MRARGFACSNALHGQKLNQGQEDQHEPTPRQRHHFLEFHFHFHFHLFRCHFAQEKVPRVVVWMQCGAVRTVVKGR